MKSRFIFGLTPSSSLHPQGPCHRPPRSPCSFSWRATAQKSTLPNVLGGASAQTRYAFDYPAVAPICVHGTLDIFYDPAQTTPVPLPSGSNYRAYSCTLVAEASLPPSLQQKGLGGKNILIHYRLLSGSWIGVGPLSRAQAVTQMLVDGTCTQPLPTPPSTTPIVTPVPNFPLPNAYDSPSWICPNATTAIPDVGVSDQEPAIFFGANAPNDGVPQDVTQFPITPADVAKLQVQPLQGILMNVIASKKLVNALQASQAKPVTGPTVAITVEADYPNITSTQVSGLLTNNGGAYNSDFAALLKQPTDTHVVHVCRRVSAVGTQIAANAFWLNYPCTKTAAPPPTGPVFPPKIANAVDGGVYNDGKYTVTEANLVADLRTCIQQYNNSSAGDGPDVFAIGLLFTDNNPTTENGAWDFLAVDGVAPLVPNAVSGAYRFVTTETLQYRKEKVLNTLPLTDPSNIDKFNLVTGLAVELAKPAVLAVQSGFLALPENGFIPGPPDGNNVWKATTSGPNACNPPQLFF
jgi:hypothetical protein